MKRPFQIGDLIQRLGGGEYMLILDHDNQDVDDVNSATYLCYYLGVNVNVWHGYLYIMSCYELKVCI